MTGVERCGRSGTRAAGGASAWPLTPHLTSPLEGGRDELGKRGRVLGEWWAREQGLVGVEEVGEAGG